MNSKRLTKEISDLQNAGWDIELVDDKITEWQLALSGPDNSPYFGGTFLLSLVFPEDYPFGAPKLRFLTKIYHPNIDIKGGVCMGVLKDDWRPVITVQKLLVMVNALLVQPNPDDPLNVEAAKLLVSDPKAYAEKAKTITEKYAT